MLASVFILLILATQCHARVLAWRFYAVLMYFQLGHVRTFVYGVIRKLARSAKAVACNQN